MSLDPLADSYTPVKIDQLPAQADCEAIFRQNGIPQSLTFHLSKELALDDEVPMMIISSHRAGLLGHNFALTYPEVMPHQCFHAQSRQNES